jgi:hypothetical protein
VTEAEWLACDDPMRMLRSAHGRRRFPVPERRWRLLACAAARRVCAGFNDACRRSIDVAERIAEGQATPAEIQIAQMDLLVNRDESVAGFNLVRNALWMAWRAHSSLFSSMTAVVKQAADVAGPGERPVQCELIRDVFGDRFVPLSPDPAWLTADVTALAQSAYDERILPEGRLQPDRLAVLADALEDAECADEPLLAHLRGGRPHVRGCFVIDALLGKP